MRIPEITPLAPDESGQVIAISPHGGESLRCKARETDVTLVVHQSWLPS